MLWIHVTAVSYITQVIYYSYLRTALKSVLLTETEQSFEENI